MSSIETTELDRKQRDTLLTVARQSIDHGLSHGRPLPVNPSDYPAPLQALRATFVTLHENGQLRGCIGTLEAHRALVEDVAENAFSAAFRDPRFAPVSAAEHDQMDLDISVLSPATPMQFDSEQDLLRQLRPGIDGLVLEDGPYRGTFLPSVWEQLSEPLDFLHQLKRKAGLSADYWSPSLKVSRYVTESFT
jgi:AmmeMemoRadiSam system protein A